MPPSTLRLDLVSAYGASAARIASWVIISALLYRYDLHVYAMFALVRATISILNYTTLGLAPAVTRLLAEASRPAASRASPADESAKPVLAYVQPSEPDSSEDAGLAEVYSNALAVALLSAAMGLVVTLLYAHFFSRLHRVPIHLTHTIRGDVVMIGLAAVIRLMSDVPAAVLQIRRAIALDNLLLIAAEGAWVTICTWFYLRYNNELPLRIVAGAYLVASLLLLATRGVAVHWIVGRLALRSSMVSRRQVLALLSFGVMVAASQLADFLYAPIDYVLINRFLGAKVVADYAPAVQIDAGLLLLVSGISSVLLPRVALAHVNENLPLVRRYYVLGTMATLAILCVAAVFVWSISFWLFQIWFGVPMTATRAILPLILIHTVIGGSSIVGRSILLGMGKVRPFTISVLVAGVANVVLSWLFVSQFKLGLKGIVLGTIIAVVGRCAIWMPWYVLRTLNRQAPQPR